MKKETEPSMASSRNLHTDGGRTKANAIDIPSISLPKGGGAIKGIDEKFSVNAVNGTATLSIPLPFSPARGASPELSLNYNSGAGNGVFGLGWCLSLPSIKRKTDKALPKYLDSDAYLFSEAEELVPELGKEPDGGFNLADDGNYIIREKDAPDGLCTIRFYRPRIEGLFSRIERWAHKATGEIKWRVTTKDNITTLFGWSAASRIADPKNENKIFAWLPEFVFDDKGNCAHYLYKKEDDKGFDTSLLHHRNRRENGSLTYTNRYLEKVLYGNKTPFLNLGDAYPAESDYLFQTVFDYGEYDPHAPYAKSGDWDFRQDAFSEYGPGFEVRTTRRCQRVLLFHYFAELPGGSALVKSVNFLYDSPGEADFSLLKSITAFGYIKKPDGAYTHQNLPPTEFEYQKHHWNRDIHIVSQEEPAQPPTGWGEAHYQFTDLFNEGLSGMLGEQGGAWFYKHNLGDGRFSEAKSVSTKPSFAGVGSRLHLVDLESDGYKQLVQLHEEPKGYFEMNGEAEWEAFRSFENLPNIPLGDANARLLDLNGDGKPEILITEDNCFTWFEFTGRKGFRQAHKTAQLFDEEKGPHLVFADMAQTIFLADMSGDGLTDIVRIRNREVCYWPNLGYGKFGAKVSMDNAPVFDLPDAFNPAYLRLADIDGSGTADIVYLGKNKFTCWINRSGNRFSTAPFEIDGFPALHHQSKIWVTDLLGNGVACIVWSSNLAKDTNAPLKYIDLMNRKKPHILVSYKNNLGKEVSLEYTPSTKFYLEDRLAGRPWVTKLHFPVHCVSKTETRDRVSGHRFVSVYTYHHGHYDHAEREFRGFGMVEQMDTEAFEHWVKGKASNIVDKTLHQAPVVTKQWFHTGAFSGRGNIHHPFAHEYWFEEMARQGFAVAHREAPLSKARLSAAPGLHGSVADDLSGEEWREALRACKGAGLRTEVFARDAPGEGATPEQVKKQLTPYTVAARGYLIEVLQPKGPNEHAVFAVKQCEAITYHYERDAEDPRIVHNLNTRSDEYGNVLESAVVFYPRIRTDASLPLETRQSQQTTRILYSRNRFTEDALNDDSYRLRLPSEMETFELSGVAKTGTFYSVGDFEGILSEHVSSKAEYFESDRPPVAEMAQRRLLEHSRKLYSKNDLSGPLPLHRLESRALLFEDYQLAYTPALLADIFGPRVYDDLMLEGKFTHFENDDAWWVRSGAKRWLEHGETVADAQNRFYSPIAYSDPFGATTKVRYYGNYFLFIEETEDALGNKTRVDRFNFRTLAPGRMKDANANLSEVLVDELGFVKALALFGKGNEADDLTGIDEFTTAAEQARIADFLNAPDSVRLCELGKNLLQQSTARFVYDLNMYRNRGKPAVAVSIAREEHFQKNDDAPVRLGFEYSDGLGQIVMKKAQAEPGTAQQVVVGKDHGYTVSEIDTGTLNPKQLRWIGSGRTVLNNKGNTVKQYEPYLSVTHRYEDLRELVETGVTPLMYYDAAGRLIKTEMPDGTFSKTELTAWKRTFYDANDTVLNSPWYRRRANRLIDAEPIAEGKDPVKEKAAADLASKHADTPEVQCFDTMARPILSVEHNKNPITGTDEYYPLKTTLDIEGNPRAITDARGNVTMRYKYDMLGNKVYRHGMDGGRRWLLQNILGDPLRTWDERNHELQYYYDDPLHRLTRSKVVGGDGAVPLDHVFDRRFYGEEEERPESKNLRGRMVKHYDTAGLIATPEYDFKGQPKTTTRTLFKDYKGVPNWIDERLTSDLETDSFTFSTETDALGKMTRQTAPDGSVIARSYNEAGLLKSETVTHAGAATATVYIKDIRYNAKARFQQIVYGNDVVTQFHYDKETFRLKRLETKRRNGDPLQDWRYTFDPVGNITHIEDKNIPVVFFDNQKIAAVSTYTYDALYRLRTATGRENNAPLAFDREGDFHDAAFMQRLNPGDPMAMRAYSQSFQYDEAGNMLQIKHRAAGNDWTRDYGYGASNNRLQSTRVGNRTFSYPHHAGHGFVTAMPHLEEMVWSFEERLMKTIRQRRMDGGTPETTYYQYDGQGNRIRKITEYQAEPGKAPTKKEERIYIEGYERYKKYGGANAGLERISLSLTDETHRFAIIETRNDVDDGTAKHLVRYQLHNHLGSACLELDGSASATVISYEEYHPYGTTAYQANNAAVRAAAKRYRFTGMERDEESGLAYHGARYYAPWLGRWLSCDPLFEENRVANGKSTSGKEGEKNPLANPFGEMKNPPGRKPPNDCRGENRDTRNREEPSRKPQDGTDSETSRERRLPEPEDLSHDKNINPYAYCSQNPIIYRDPTGKVGVLQAWWGAYDNADTAGKVGYGFLLPFAWLIHVILNLIVLFLSITLFNPLGLFGALDFSWGGIQSVAGLVVGIGLTLLGADVSPGWGMGAKVEAPEYIGHFRGFSLGPVATGPHGFSHWAHEFGHTWQSRVLGPFYLFIIGIVSGSSSATWDTWTERWAEAWKPSWIN